MSTSKPLNKAAKMPSQPKNKLTLEPITDAAGNVVNYRLFGYVLTPNKAGVWTRTKIRRWNKNLGALEQEKIELETAALQHEHAIQAGVKPQQTFLTADQLRDAEAAFRRLPSGRTLFECVEAADAILGSGAPISCADAIKAWDEQMTLRKLMPKTKKNNLGSIRRFIDAIGVKMVGEITPKHVERFVYRPGFAALTGLGYARVIHAFGQFCVEEKYLKVNFCRVSLTALTERARPASEPKILTPEECQRLLDAAVATNNPRLVAFVILQTWGFMRRHEVEKLRADEVTIRQDGSVIVHARSNKRGGRWRPVPIPPNVAPLLAECIKRGAIQAEVKNAAGKIVVRAGIYADWAEYQKLREQAGLLELAPNPNCPSRKIIKQSSWTQHILRHTGMSYLFQETGGDADLVTRRAGNTEDIAFMHYLRRAEDEAFKKFNAVTATLPAPNEATGAVA